MRIIAGTWRGHRIAAPRGKNVRPTTDRVREAWMSAMGGYFDGLEVADLFAGSGALGLEMLSRGARHCTFVEIARGARRALEANIETLGAEERATVMPGDALSWVSSLDEGHLDLVVADPPYGQGAAARLLELFGRNPFATELWVEHRSDEPLPDLADAVQRRYGDTTITILSASRPG